MTINPQIIFVDLHDSLGLAVRESGWPVEVRSWTNILDIKPLPGTAFVSPANSSGIMDGGIDFVLSRMMFPGVESRVRAAIADRGHISLLGRPYLPIGEAVTVPVPNYRSVFLIAAPTMWTPQSVRGTHNAYSAMCAVLAEAARAQGTITHIVVPGLATGIGGISPQDAIAQMKAAHEDFLVGRPPKFSASEIADEQPLIYPNREFKQIEPAK